jgi:hypothetical protein
MGEKDEKYTFLHNLLQPRNVEETREMYSKWAENYEEVILNFNYISSFKTNIELIFFSIR